MSAVAAYREAKVEWSPDILMDADCGLSILADAAIEELERKNERLLEEREQAREGSTRWASIQALPEVSALQRENERLREMEKDLPGRWTLAKELQAVKTELLLLKPLARFQHGVTTCPSCHAIMRWEQGEVAEWTANGLVN